MILANLKVYVKEREIDIVNIIMISCIVGYVILPTVFNLIVVTHKRKRTNKICIEKLEGNGYEIDVRFKNTLAKKSLKYILEENDTEYYKSDYVLELVLASWFPLLRWYDLYCNFKYLQGDYTGLNETYSYIEDNISVEKVIDYLKKQKLIKEDRKKMQFIEDRDKALDELMARYDKKDIYDTLPKKEPINCENLIKMAQENSEDIVFSKKDSLTELNEKLDQLRQLISEKQNEESSEEVRKNPQIKGYVFKPENK